MLPTLFIGHGSPQMALVGGPTHDFFGTLWASLSGRAGGQPRPSPQAVLCVSAHWETEAPAVSGASEPETIHDFYGFPPPLYALRYPAPGAPVLAARVRDKLAEAGLEATIDPQRGLDHGAWIPLRQIFPAADVPVAQLSIQTHLGPAHHLRLGRALRGLAEEGVLVIGSGNVTHNLGDMDRAAGVDSPPAPWVEAFAGWVHDRLQAGDVEALADYRTSAPHGAHAHPRDDHYLPLLVAAGAARDPRGVRLHDACIFGTLSMAAYGFDLD